MSRSLALLAPARAPRRMGLIAMLALHRQRRQLAKLDAAALRDIGVSREAAKAEATRAPWDAPAHWRG
ncbi:DUF1127 domain-containing protein [Mesobacterium pallidum]|uniref:DUF1127 domain-containing protein n=1 Tax=Mesobacterium pallidum TaxID=2872037 RepID=UPI001EE2B6EA|nr:DUF1127 domain-containing protein [Mesobacterium pallidum]